MINKNEYWNMLKELAGKTIAIIYIFENEDADGFNHYDIWKGNLISSWLNAIQELKCIPYILDVRTFLFKVANNTLPHIDFVINMNAGCVELSTLGLVPSVCGFNNIECIPCNTSAIIAGENKLLANMIADSLGFNIPKEVPENQMGIYRPLNFGSSKGICRTQNSISVNDAKETISGILQEFITGYDVTTPLLYNPLSKSIEALPTIFYIPETNDVNWFFGAEAKESDLGFSREIMPLVEKELIAQYKTLMGKMNIDTYCRIDARMKTDKLISAEELPNTVLTKNNTYFIEINPMPTIEIGNNFHISVTNVPKTNSFFEPISYYKEYVKNHSAHGFILSCALIKRLISKH